MEAGIRERLPPAKTRWEPLEAGRSEPSQCGPATSIFQTSGLQNRETTKFCCVKSASLWYFAAAALGGKYTSGSGFMVLWMYVFILRPSPQRVSATRPGTTRSGCRCVLSVWNSVCGVVDAHEIFGPLKNEHMHGPLSLACLQGLL